MIRVLTFFLGVLLSSPAAAQDGNRRADSIPDYQPIEGWPQLPPKVELGPVSAVAADAKDNIYVAHRGPKPILVFDRTGRFLASDRRLQVWISLDEAQGLRDADGRAEAPPLPGVPAPHDVEADLRWMLARMIEARERRVELLAEIIREA